VGLELLERLGGVVDKGETSGLATTELGPQTEDVDLLLGGLVELSQLSTELFLGDVGAAGVEDVTINSISDENPSKPPRLCRIGGDS
jgi:hypothetical protein